MSNHWLQPTYSAQSCSLLMLEKLWNRFKRCIILDAASFWLWPVVMDSDVSPRFISYHIIIYLKNINEDVPCWLSTWALGQVSVLVQGHIRANT